MSLLPYKSFMSYLVLSVLISCSAYAGSTEYPATNEEFQEQVRFLGKLFRSGLTQLRGQYAESLSSQMRKQLETLSQQRKISLSSSPNPLVTECMILGLLQALAETNKGENHREFCKELLASFHNFNPLLMRAILTNKTEAIQLLIVHGADLNFIPTPSTDSNFIPTPKRREECPFARIAKAAYYLYDDIYVETPLILVTQIADTSMAKFLIQHGARVNQADYEGHTALRRAVQRKTKDMVKLLLEHGADPNFMPTPKEHEGDPFSRIERAMPTLLCLAAQSADTSIAELLIQYGARVDQVNYDGHTALTKAVQEKNKDMVKLLLEYDANANHNFFDCFSFGRWPHHGIISPLVSAIGPDNTSLISLLLKYGADPNQEIRETFIPHLTPLTLTLSLASFEAYEKGPENYTWKKYQPMVVEMINHGATHYAVLLKLLEHPNFTLVQQQTFGQIPFPEDFDFSKISLELKGLIRNRVKLIWKILYEHEIPNVCISIIGEMAHFPQHEQGLTRLSDYLSSLLPLPTP